MISCARGSALVIAFASRRPSLGIWQHCQQSPGKRTGVSHIAGVLHSSIRRKNTMAVNQRDPVRPRYRMLPEVTPYSEAFWTGGAQGELRIYRCRSCRRWFHPPVGACFRCRSPQVGPETASGRATVAAFTVNHHQWFEGFPPPYVVAIVELAEEPDVRLTTQIVGCSVDDVAVGMPVEATFEAWDEVWIPVFRPVAS